MDETRVILWTDHTIANTRFTVSTVWADMDIDSLLPSSVIWQWIILAYTLGIVSSPWVDWGTDDKISESAILPCQEEHVGTLRWDHFSKKPVARSLHGWSNFAWHPWRLSSAQNDSRWSEYECESNKRSIFIAAEPFTTRFCIRSRIFIVRERSVVLTLTKSTWTILLQHSIRWIA
jgi:hypothetical protein